VSRINSFCSKKKVQNGQKQATAVSRRPVINSQLIIDINAEFFTQHSILSSENDSPRATKHYHTVIDTSMSFRTNEFIKCLQNWWHQAWTDNVRVRCNWLTDYICYCCSRYKTAQRHSPLASRLQQSSSNRSCVNLPVWPPIYSQLMQ